MQQHQSTIDKIFAYDNITIRANYDILYERQRVDRWQEELRKMKWDVPTLMSKMNDKSAVEKTIHQLEHTNEFLQEQWRNVATQVQEATLTPAEPPKVPSSSSSALLLPESEITAQQQQQEKQALDLLSLQEYKTYCQELEHHLDEQRDQHTHTVEILQQQIQLLQESLQATRQRLLTRDGDVDRLSYALEHYKRQNSLVPVPPSLPHSHHHHHPPEFPISPLSMTDSMVEGAGESGGHRHNHFSDTTNHTTDTIATLPPPHDNTSSSDRIREKHKDAVLETTTMPDVDAITAAAVVNSVPVGQSSSSCRSVLSSSSNINVHHNTNKSVTSDHTTRTSYSSFGTRKLLAPLPPIRSDVDRAQALVKLEDERIHNARMVQQLRQSVLQQQQQQQQQQQAVHAAAQNF